MSLRGEPHRAAIRSVLDAFGGDAAYFVFLGGCVLGLYARPSGAPLRATKDVDCISTRSPWVIQERVLAELCTRGILTPDRDLQGRYRIRKVDLDVDVLSPDGTNVGPVNPWFRRAAEHARLYELGDGRSAKAVTPPYFLATKLVAFANRAVDAVSSKDMEDVVTLAVEVEDLAEQVAAAGLREEVASLWGRSLRQHAVRGPDVPDMVDGHLDSRDVDHRARVIDTLYSLISWAEGARS